MVLMAGGVLLCSIDEVLRALDYDLRHGPVMLQEMIPMWVNETI